MKKHSVIFIVILLFFTLLHSTEIIDVKKSKSSTIGVLWSIGSTCIPMGVGSLVWLSGESKSNNVLMWTGGLLAVSGAIVGPDIGHFYAQKWARGRERAGIRFTIGLALGLSTAYLMAGAMTWDQGETNQTADKIMYGAWILSGCGYIVYTIWDIATVPCSVHEYNKSIVELNKLHISPRIDIVSKKCGLSLVYTF
jgi:uncharacterized membrane protein